MSVYETSLLLLLLLFPSLKEKIQFILSATAQHARNLAFFALIYKAISIFLNKLRGQGHPLHNFIGGLCGGYLVFGTNNKVNMQVSLVYITEVKYLMITVHDLQVNFNQILNTTYLLDSLLSTSNFIIQNFIVLILIGIKIGVD